MQRRGIPGEENCEHEQLQEEKTQGKKVKFGHCGWQKLLARDEGQSLKPPLFGAVSWANFVGIYGFMDIWIYGYCSVGSRRDKGSTSISPSGDPSSFWIFLGTGSANRI